MAVTETANTSRPPGWLEQKRNSRIIDFVVIPGLLVLALLLPPISVGQRISDLGATRIALEGGTISDKDGTQVIFAPGTFGAPLRASLASVPRIDFLSGNGGAELREAAKALPASLVMKSPYYALTLSGAAPNESTWVLPIPNDSEPYETLDLYTWEPTGQTWQWLPHSIIREDDMIESKVPAVPGSLAVMQTNPQPAVVGADLEQAASLPTEGQGALAVVNATGLSLGDSGAIDGALDATFDQARGAYAVVPVIKNYDGPVVRNDLLANMLVDSAQRDAHINALVDLAVASLYEGIDVDYRGLDPNLRGEFNQFVKDLSERLHEQGKTLGIRVEPPVQVAEDRWDTGAYDWQTLGLLADVVKIPAPVDPKAYVAGGQLDALLNYAVGQVNRYKLQLVLNGQSVEQAGSYLLQKDFGDALQPLLGRIESDQSVIEPGQPMNLALVAARPTSGLVYDPNIGVYTYKYQDDQGAARTVWLENAASLSHKLELLKNYNIQGFTLENLPADGADADLWPLMRDYQQGMLKPIESNFVVEWRMKNENGDVVSQVRPLTDPNLSVLAPQEPGEIAIEAAILDRGNVLAQQDGLMVAIATYTPVATPTPEFTPTPEPTATPEFAELSVTSATANVRAGPSTAYARIGQARRGETYQITGTNEAGDWYQISFEGDPGWLTTDLVAVNGTVDGLAVIAVEAPAAPVAAAEEAAPAAPAAAKPAAPAAKPAASYPAAGGYFGYGVQAHMIHNDYAGSVMQMTNAMGFKWVKQQIEWKIFEASPGQTDWSEMDRLVGEANGSGINLLFSVVNAPGWAREGGFDGNVGGPPADPNTLASFLGAMATKYCGSSLKAIEVWNEQNLHYEWGNMPLDPAAYMALLKPSYSAIKRACPSMVVVSGALTPTGAPAPWAMDDFAYLEGMYKNGLKQYSDAIGAHPSGFNVPPDVRHENACATIQRTGNSFNGPCENPHHSWSFRSTMEGYRNIMVKYGDTGKRVWPTEFGWAAGGAFDDRYKYANDNDLQEQAQWTKTAYQMMRDWGFVGPAFLWNLNFRVVANGSEKAQWGILDASGGPLPAYNALAGMPK